MTLKLATTKDGYIFSVCGIIKSMTIHEFRIKLDIEDPTDVLNANAKKCKNDWLFVDSNDGQCYLFDKNGKEKDIDELTMIHTSMFYNDKTLTKIVIPSSVKSIETKAFSYCSRLTDVTIGNGVTSIGNGAFYGCSRLTSVNITDLATWCNISFDDSSANPLFYAYNFYLNGKKVTELTIPNNVTSINGYAFYYCTRLKAVTIPNNVTSIGDWAFDSCTSLMNVTIGNNVMSIGKRAFGFCSQLKSLFFKGKTYDQVKNMKNYPFGIEDESIIKCES